MGLDGGIIEWVISRIQCELVGTDPEKDCIQKIFSFVKGWKIMVMLPELKVQK
jgi:hypothetical protein